MADTPSTTTTPAPDFAPSDGEQFSDANANVEGKEGE